MAFIDDDVLDNGVGQLQANVDEIHICSQQPSTFLQATSTYSLGKKTNPTLSAPQDRTGGGREVEAAAFADGVVDADGTASHFAWVDTINSRLYAWQALSATQVVTSPNSFEFTAAHAIGIPDAV